MAFENLFIRTIQSLEGVQLDAILSETHNNNVRITKNPVELGADITDHAVIESKRLTMVAQVSDTPLGTAALGEIVDTTNGLFGTATSDNLTRSEAAYNSLVTIMELREPIKVQTKLVDYPNMIITSINTNRDKDTSRIVRMNITLEEVLITESQVVKLESRQLEEGSPREQGTSAESKGRQEVITPSSTTSTSALKTITDWVVS
jgi:hypothetical protein